MMQRILAIGLNPVLQKSLVFERFQPGSVNRAAERYLTAGGKGIHYAMAANRIVPGCATVAHFLGGEAGRDVAARLAAAGTPELSIDCAGETRMCTTVLCRATGTMTELIEPSPMIAAAEAAAMREAIFARLAEFAGIGLCGTFPPGVGGDLYAEVTRRKGRAVVMLDGYKGVDETLATGAVDVLKINLDELRELTGETDMRVAADRCRETYGIGTLALTDGPARAFLVNSDGAWGLDLPRLETVVNPIGAGDTVGAVTLCRLLQGVPAVEAFADGLAAASASCMHIQGAQFELPDMERLRAGIRIGAL